MPKNDDNLKYDSKRKQIVADTIISIPKIFLCTCAIAGLLILIFIAGEAVLSQATTWLKYGYAPERDLYWLIADSECSSSNVMYKGFSGRDLCRTEKIVFTEMVGMNKIVHYIFDIHIIIISFMMYYLGKVIVLTLVNEYEKFAGNLGQNFKNIVNITDAMLSVFLWIISPFTKIISYIAPTGKDLTVSVSERIGTGIGFLVEMAVFCAISFIAAGLIVGLLSTVFLLSPESIKLIFPIAGITIWLIVFGLAIRGKIVSSNKNSDKLK